jgi:succinate dehydrogenase / fumarate reductase flavoprotein subunit
LVFGKRAGEHAARYAKDSRPGNVQESELEGIAKQALAPFERDPKNSPYGVQHDLQDMMQSKVGIVRVEKEMREALSGLQELKERAKTVGVSSHREYNPGWHTALDLDSLLTVSEAIALAAVERKESRGGHFRDDYPEKNPEFAKFNYVIRKGAGGQMEIRKEQLPPMREDLKAVIEEQK